MRISACFLLVEFGERVESGGEGLGISLAGCPLLPNCLPQHESDHRSKPSGFNRFNIFGEQNGRRSCVSTRRSVGVFRVARTPDQLGDKRNRV